MKAHVKRSHVLFRKAYADHFSLPDSRYDPGSRTVSETDYIAKAQRHKLCVRIRNVKDGLAEYRAERKQRWYENVNPYVGGGQRWAMPYATVVCESGAGSGSSNYYGLLQGWDEWNAGLAPVADAGSAPKLHQDIAAHRGLVLHGGWWECPV